MVAPDGRSRPRRPTPPDSDADTVAVGLFEGEGEARRGCPPEAAELLDSGEARAKLGSVALAHADGRRWLLVGLGAREELTPERARVAAAAALERALRALRHARSAGCCPTGGDGARSPRRSWRARARRLPLRALQVRAARGRQPRASSGSSSPCPDELEGAVGDAAVVAAAREPRARPAEPARATTSRPTRARRARARRSPRRSPELSVEVEGRDGHRRPRHGRVRRRGPGLGPGAGADHAALRAAVGARARVLAFVGKAVTFDSGGISLKPGAKMSEMKFDMSGGAAVIEASAAIAALGLPVSLRGGGRRDREPAERPAVKPGDIVTAANGTTIEVNNTDAEGRLVLADCLCHAVAEGAERIVDLATLTGAVIVALGSHLRRPDEQRRRARRADRHGRRRAHRRDRLAAAAARGVRRADQGHATPTSTTPPKARKAGTIVGGAFLSNFVGETPWAHLDIAGSAWDLGRAYVGKGASGLRRAPARGAGALATAA